MKTLPTQAQGHLVVAAMRVVQFKLRRPATDAEIAAILDLPPEEVAHWARGLQAHGVVRLVESAFDVRYELMDHTLLDTLPEDEGAPALEGEIEAFHERHKEKQASLDNLFGEGDARKKGRMSKLEDELKKFKSGKTRSPFDSDEDE